MSRLILSRFGKPVGALLLGTNKIPETLIDVNSTVALDYYPNGLSAEIRESRDWRGWLPGSLKV